MRLRDDCLQIRGLLVHFHALLEGDRVILIDGGFLGNPVARLSSELERLGRSLDQISDIVISHGHIDHTLRIAEWKRITSAKVWAPVLDRDSIHGQGTYRGVSRICGILEWLTRMVFHFQRPEVDNWFHPEETLPLWRDGLQVISLPGHTAGHCGFYSAEKKFLFACDLFSNFRGRVKLPPPWFNQDSLQLQKSVIHALELDLSGGVTINHCHLASAEEHRRDLEQLGSCVLEKEALAS